MACVFCALMRGEIPRWVVDEDEEVIAFLPLEPEVLGHTLVVPRAHHAGLDTIPPALLARVVTFAQRLSRDYARRIGAAGCNLMLASGTAAQQSVAHLHFHLLPRFDGDGLDTWPTLPRQRFDKDEMLQALRRGADPPS